MWNRYSRYWEKETPQVVQGERNLVAWYRDAQKLQISLPDWMDGEGTVRRSKTVTLDVYRMRKTPEHAAQLKQILEDVLAMCETEK